MECSGYRGLEDLSGGDSVGEPPVPIPNTEVKPVSADGTWGATPWESRSPPDMKPTRGRYSFIGWRPLAIWSEMPPKQPNRPDRRPGQSERRQPNRRQPDRRQSEGNRSRDGDDRQPRRGAIAAVPTGDLPRCVP